MLLKKWEELPSYMQCSEVHRYYIILSKCKGSLMLKRIFDVLVSSVMLFFLSPVFLMISLAIVLDSPGGVFFRQVRITAYGREFRIFKFRTMVANAEKMGEQITSSRDCRITRVGKMLRNCRLDEIPQLLNILLGDMTFVGTRPEVPQYVAQYSPEMYATLLLPAGVTSEASIHFKDETILLEGAKDLVTAYVNLVLPQKMVYNLRALENFKFTNELQTMYHTVWAVLGKNALTNISHL